jgi:phage terminase small subunit
VANKRADLTPKEQIFIREYLIDGNGTRAAVAAGYAAASAGVAASKLLKKAKVRTELDGLRAGMCEKLEISAERVLQGLAQLAWFDPRKFYEKEVRVEDGKIVEQRGALRQVIDLDDAEAFALQGIDVQKLFRHYGKGASEEIGTLTKIRFADRGLALERLGRYLKLFTDKVELTNTDAVMQKLKEGRARVAAAKAGKQIPGKTATK